MNADSNDPIRIRPFFETPIPDGEIVLIEEPGKLIPTNKDESVRADGIVKVIQRWSPMRVQFEFNGELYCSEDSEDDEQDKNWSYFGDEVDIQATSFSATGLVEAPSDDGLAGIIDADEVIAGTDHKLDRVTFHIPNYPDPAGGRFVQDRGEGDSGGTYDWSEIRLEASGWRIKLQPIRQIREANWAAEDAYGTVLNGVGEIRRIELQQFSPKEATSILEALHYFLSFAFLEWTPPLLVVGSNSVKEKSWQYFRNHTVRRDRYVGLKGFVPVGGGDSLSHAFQGFLSKWQNSSWQEPLQAAIRWLIESSIQSDRDENGGIAFSQIPLEMLAWMVFVDETEIVNENEFDKLSASSKMQLLLAHCQIGFEVPKGLKTLSKIAQNTKHTTGPQLLTKVRNTIIHPSKKNRAVLSEWESKFGTTPDSIRREAQQLFEHYITLVLLFLIGYEGKFRDRTNSMMFGDKTVPWVSPNDGRQDM